METTEATLRVMIPVEIDDTTLTSTTEAEADYAAYNAATATYALGDRVISATSHRIYERATATATAGKDPDDIDNRIANAAGIIFWIDVSATNAWKMFDGESSSRTVATSPLTIVLAPGFISGLYVGGIVNADSVTITLKDAPGGTTVYTDAITLEDSLPPDYYEYCFAPFHQQSDFVSDDLPPYYTGELTITFTAASGSIEIGMMRVGDLRPLGNTQLGVNVEPKSYSTIKIDDYGNNEIVRRKKARDMELVAHVEQDYADTVVDILTQVNDVPSVWVGTTMTGYTALRVFGLGNGKMNYTNPNDFFMNLTVKGLI